MKNEKRMSTALTLTFSGIMTALVLVLQLLGAFIKFGPFSISLVLVPIVLGAAVCGPGIGAWLGLVFAGAVFLSGDAGRFLAISVPGTLVTVIAKGVACGFAAGLVYRLLCRWNQYVAVLVAAVVCPVVNTGVFLIGCRLFFWDTITQLAGDSAYGSNVVGYLFLGFIGANFLFELGTNMILSPVILRLLNISKKFRLGE